MSLESWNPMGRILERIGLWFIAFLMAVAAFSLLVNLLVNHSLAMQLTTLLVIFQVTIRSAFRYGAFTCPSSLL